MTKKPRIWIITTSCHNDVFQKHWLFSFCKLSPLSMMSWICREICNTDINPNENFLLNSFRYILGSNIYLNFSDYADFCTKFQDHPGGQCIGLIEVFLFGSSTSSSGFLHNHTMLPTLYTNCINTSKLVPGVLHLLGSCP